jgi:2-polyprenyl-3-methyl-5-hydroxy-6-metoxy-1,4-benzoquinol methylase
MAEPEYLDIWGVAIPAAALSAAELDYLTGLPENVPSHEWLCAEIDRVWQEFGLDNRRSLEDQPIDEFYRHPVWLMNGLFSAADQASAMHRRAIAVDVAKLNPDAVVDVGGGFGELALRISDATPAAKVHILEPFPSAVGEARLSRAPGVQFVSELAEHAYDVVIAQDVLEHVEDPVGLAIDLTRAVRPGGTAIFANNFTPIIQCHLPRTFHLRRTFRLVMRALGLTYIGKTAKAEHALHFEAPSVLHVRRARVAEWLSRLVAPATEAAATTRRKLRGGTDRTGGPAA